MNLYLFQPRRRPTTLLMITGLADLRCLKVVFRINTYFETHHFMQTLHILECETRPSIPPSKTQTMFGLWGCKVTVLVVILSQSSCKHILCLTSLLHFTFKNSSHVLLVTDVGCPWKSWGPEGNICCAKISFLKKIVASIFSSMFFFFFFYKKCFRFSHFKFHHCHNWCDWCDWSHDQDMSASNLNKRK